MIVLTFGTRLNAQSWAEALTVLPAGSLRGERVLVDLTEVGFADFVTLGHLLVFVRAAAAAGAGCAVRLPSAEALPSGTPPDSNAARRIVERHKCRLYLEQSGVVEALGPHLDARPAAGEGAPAPAAEADARVAPPTSERPHRYRRILRYRWLPRESVQNITLVTRPTETERTLRELGLPSETAAAVTRGVLLELLENAERHSGAGEILLGGVIVDPHTYGLRADDFDPSLREFARHAAAVKSPLIRLVVADTGRGMATGVAAFDTRPGGAAGGAARGLWKVARVVRAYQGALLLTTGGRAAGRIYRGGEAVDVAGPAPAALPGAFVECDVLARPGEAALADAGELVTPRLRPAPARPGLTCVAVPLYAPSGLRAEDGAGIRAALAASGEIVVAVNVPHGGHGAHDVEIGRAVAQVIDIVAGAGGSRRATLAFPSVNRPLMAVAVEHLNAEHDDRAAAGAEVPPPILVLAPDNRHYWAGGTSEQRRALGRLSTGTGPLPIPAFPAGEAEAVAGLADRTALLVVTGDRVALRTSPQDAATALGAWVGDQIARAVAEAPSGPGPGDVWRGRFLTPSLRETSRWFDLDPLLSRLDLWALAGMTLAARVEEVLAGPAEAAPPVVVRLAHTPPATVAALARSVTGQDGYHDSLHDVPPGDGPVRVLLVTDAVSSRTTVGGMLADVLDREMEPVAVATVVDARAAADRAAHPRHIELRGRRIPLVSVATVDVAAEDGEDGAGDALPIDPVLRRPEYGRRPVPSQLIEQEEYLRAMQRNAAARLGHIERPADRHYTAYVDPTLLFREEEWSRAVLAELAEEIGKRHRESFDDPHAKASVLFPEGTADDLTTAARRLRKALIEAGLSVDEPIPVPRAAHAANWQLPGSVTLPRVEHAVILDSGASSGRTVQQLVGLAADKNAVTVTVVLLLNGLSDSDAVNLQRIATVRRSGHVEDPAAPDDRAALQVFYVARTAMSSLPSGHCAVCALRRRYASVTLYAPIPEPLAEHRAWLLGLLEARTKQALFSEQAADLFGANVSQPECVAYLHWRLRLREAALDTARRQRVADRLAAAGANRLSRDALIRLLVAESQWLTEAPLSFPECRSMIAEMAASMLVDNAALLIEQRLRVQAVILLAQVAPERFAADLGRMLRTNRDESLVIPQVLLEALLLISAPRGAAPYPRHRVAQRLTESLVHLQDGLRDKDEAPKIRSRFVTLPLVRYLLSHARRPLEEPPAGKQEAWSRLRHEMSSAGHDFSNPVWLAGTGIELAAAGGPVRDPEAIRDSWATCENHLQRAVIPCLEPLRDILLSKTVLGDMTREEAARWEETLSVDGARAIDETTIRVDEIVEKIKMGAVPGADQAGALLADLQWWLRFALDTDTALLRKVIARGPVDIVATVREYFDEPDDEIDQHRDTFVVFCTNRLIREVFAHIRLNARKTHRIAGSEQRFRVELDPGAERIAVTVRNTGSGRDSQGGGKGLETLRHRLERFGGTIAETGHEPPWTYAVTVELDRWRMPA